ncbi:hypothetical protein P2G74_01330 [Cronobacter muytjensii]|uniref:hypothetical protein n=1 Tax=Cronobacter muytjensii TaxID=413501 RepID=UPI002DBA8EC6|nr:hypothetical protein [Cronobacter muytjensii]MEB8638615.1 hypothetical protein [Cronobacter muytjensii]
MTETENLPSTGDDEIRKAVCVYDDGRDWSAYLVWQMNARRRISEKKFALPPARPQVSKPTIAPRKKPRSVTRRKLRIESD